MIVARGDLVWITVVMVLIGILTFLIMLQDLVQMDGLGGSWRCFFAPRPLHEERTPLSEAGAGSGPILPSARRQYERKGQFLRMHYLKSTNQPPSLDSFPHVPSASTVVIYFVFGWNFWDRRWFSVLSPSAVRDISLILFLFLSISCFLIGY